MWGAIIEKMNFKVIITINKIVNRMEHREDY